MIFEVSELNILTIRKMGRMIGSLKQNPYICGGVDLDIYVLLHRGMV